jgi:hypothetical protein
MLLRHTTLNICMYIHTYMYIKRDRREREKKIARERRAKRGQEAREH